MRPYDGTSCFKKQNESKPQQKDKNSIFLSFLEIHCFFSPYSLRIRKIHYHRAKYKRIKMAMTVELVDSCVVNEVAEKIQPRNCEYVFCSLSARCVFQLQACVVFSEF
jgi:hypothetical protein